MRVVIIVLVVVAIGFAAVALLGGTGGANMDSKCAPPRTEDGKVTEDSVDGWKPCGMSAWLASVTSPFAPRLKLDAPVVALAAGGTDTRAIAAYSPWIGPDMRVAHIAMQSPGGMIIQYSCPARPGRTCPDAVCICTAGVRFTALQIGACRANWRARHMLGDRCAADSAKTSFPVYPEAGGALVFTALGETGATAKVQ